MRRFACLSVALFVAAAASAASNSRGSLGTRPTGRVSGSGLSLGYNRQTSHSSLSLRFNSGTSSYSTSNGYSFYGGTGGSYLMGTQTGGFYRYRGWSPQSPYLMRSYQGVYGGTVGPFAYTDTTGLRSGVGIRLGSFEERREQAAAVVSGGRQRVGLGSPEALGGNITGLIDRGDGCFARGQFENAVEHYRAASRQGQGDAMAAFALGHGLFATGAYAEAAAALRRGLQFYPAMLGVQMNRRHFYGNPQAFDEQLDRLARHVEATPSDSSARFLLGYNYFFTQQYARAREQFEAAGAGDAEAQFFLREIRRRE